jgi:ketosteroid isomerase-like protein
MPQNTGRDPGAVARASYEAYANKDRAAIEALVADDFHFTSPLDNRLDRKTYFERCWPNSDRIKEFRLERIFVQGNEAFVRYELVPADGKSFRNVEWFRVEDGLLREVQVYFGSV